MPGKMLIWPCFIIGLLPGIAQEKLPQGAAGDFLIDNHGAIIRGSVSRREIALVFTGDEFADGGKSIRSSLKKHGVPASFFLTGKFYATPAFKNLIGNLKKDGHYLGAHSDQHLLYADWTKRDSLLVTEERFKSDLLANYERMEPFGVVREQAPYFLPPYEWYNRQISDWTRDLGFQLVNFTPGTRSTADYTYPEMGTRYVPSDVIYESIFSYEKRDPHGLNGFILLIHIGTDPRRRDKFYHSLEPLMKELKERGYRFVTIEQLLGPA